MLIREIRIFIYFNITNTPTGPCAPNTSACSISAVLEGPEMKALEPMLSRNIIKLQITDNHILSKAQSKSKSF